MRAVVVRISDQELAARRKKGLDRWDEMWAGVLHMTPAPSVEHQRLVDRLVGFLEPLLRISGRGHLFSGINVFRDDTDYRIPDLTYLVASRDQVLKTDGVRTGGPDAVIEIRSPEDETYEKLPFYASLAVNEVVVVHRDSKRVELYRLAGTQYSVIVQQDAEGWLRSEAMNVRFRAIEQPPRLVVEDAVDAVKHVEF